MVLEMFFTYLAVSNQCCQTVVSCPDLISCIQTTFFFFLCVGVETKLNIALFLAVDRFCGFSCVALGCKQRLDLHQWNPCKRIHHNMLTDRAMMLYDVYQTPFSLPTHKSKGEKKVVWLCEISPDCCHSDIFPGILHTYPKIYILPCTHITRDTYVP